MSEMYSIILRWVEKEADFLSDNPSREWIKDSLIEAYKRGVGLSYQVADNHNIWPEEGADIAKDILKLLETDED